MSTYRAVRVLAGSTGMTVNADIPNKYLKGEIGGRRMPLSAVPRLTLMLYELSSPEGMFQTLDETLRGNPHYLGWARHSYNDTLVRTFTHTAAIRALP